MSADLPRRRQHERAALGNQSGRDGRGGRSTAPEVPGELYPLTDLPDRPWMPKKNGKKLNKFTAIRWALHGRRGPRLRTTLVGSLRVTCDQWAWEFFEKLNGAEPATAMSPRRMAKDHELAEAELSAEGIG